MKSKKETPDFFGVFTYFWQKDSNITNLWQFSTKFSWFKTSWKLNVVGVYAVPVEIPLQVS